MDSVTFSTGFHVIKPGLRVSGDEISVVFKGVYDSGIYAGKKYIHIDLTNEPDLTFVEAGVAGPLDTVADVDALYTQLLDAGMTEAFDGFLVDPSDLSSIEIGNQQISFDFAGHAPYVFGRNSDPAATERVKVANQTWTLPQPDFAGAVALFTEMESPEELEFRSIEERFTAEDAQLEALIASGMWLFATQADFPPAADNHGRVVHSHADGAIFFAHAGAWQQVANEADLQTVIASLASEADIREGADDALSARLDTLESDPTTATAVAAGDATTLSSANTYTDTSITNLVNGADAALDTLKEIGDALAQGDSDVTAALTAQITTESTTRAAADVALSGRLDTLEADPTTQSALDAETTARTSADTALDGRVTALEGNAAITDPTTATALAAVQGDVDANQTASESADSALSGRLDVLEADPTTQALLDAETTARGEGDLNAIGQSNAYTDGLLNQYFSGAATEEKADAYNAVIQAGFTPIIDAIGSQIKFNDADVASVTAIAINHDSSAGRIDWFEVFPTGSVFRVIRASDSAVFDFTVTQAGVGGANNRTKNFTVTTSSTGTLVDGDVLAISTVGGPDITTSADLNVGGNILVGDAINTGEVTAKQFNSQVGGFAGSKLSRFGFEADEYDSGVLPSGNELNLKVSNQSFPATDNVFSIINFRATYFGPQVGDVTLGAINRRWTGMYLDAASLVDASNDSQAAAAGVELNQVYRSGSVLHIRVS